MSLNNVLFTLNTCIDKGQKIEINIMQEVTVLALAYSFVDSGKHSYVNEQLDFSSIRQEMSPTLYT